MNPNRADAIWTLIAWSAWGVIFTSFLVWIFIPNGHPCKEYIYWIAVPLGGCIGLLVGGLTVGAGRG